MVVVNDTSGCCATSSLVCEKSTCAAKPTKCSEQFYEIIKLDPVGLKEEICCDEYKCVPPKNKCIVVMDDGKKYLKSIGEKWPTKDPCLTKECTVDNNGLPLVKEVYQKCNEKCDIGFELEIPKGECCGKCIQTKCIVDGVLYNPGQTWFEPGNNCTHYSCVKTGNLYLVSKSEETCPDIEKCDAADRYKKGCCYFCKPKPQSLVNETIKCEPHPRLPADTIKIVKAFKAGHSNCVNYEPITGFTECKGGCNSGTRWSKPLNKHEAYCTCCQMKSEKKINVKHTCDDGFKFTKEILVPKECTCNPCASEVPQQSASYTAGVKTKPASSPYVKG